jgi:predicted  nucleic acid-binding Zn-ribbon protein
LVDLAKYETLISELGALESRVEILNNKYSDTLERNKELEVALDSVQQDKNLLHQEIVKLEDELQKLKQKSEEKINLNAEERENFKTKINDLINRIDYHLSVERKV